MDDILSKFIQEEVDFENAYQKGRLRCYYLCQSFTSLVLLGVSSLKGLYFYLHGSHREMIIDAINILLYLTILLSGLCSRVAKLDSDNAWRYIQKLKFSRFMNILGMLTNIISFLFFLTWAGTRVYQREDLLTWYQDKLTLLYLLIGGIYFVYSVPFWILMCQYRKMRMIIAFFDNEYPRGSFVTESSIYESRIDLED